MRRGYRGFAGSYQLTASRRLFFMRCRMPVSERDFYKCPAFRSQWNNRAKSIARPRAAKSDWTPSTKHGVFGHLALEFLGAGPAESRCDAARADRDHGRADDPRAELHARRPTPGFKSSPGTGRASVPLKRGNTIRGRMRLEAIHHLADAAHRRDRVHQLLDFTAQDRTAKEDAAILCLRRHGVRGGSVAPELRAHALGQRLVVGVVGTEAGRRFGPAAVRQVA